MVDDFEGLPIGARIQALRERRGKTRPVVANLVGRSAEWLKAVEKGRLQPPRIDMLMRLAEVLDVRDLAELTGSSAVPTDLQRRSGHHAVDDLREAIEATQLKLPNAEVDGEENLQRRAADAWQAWHTSTTPRASAGALLPAIIRDARRSARVLEDSERRKAHAALTSAYALAEQVLAWVADSALLWLAADRCMASAEQADDPHALAGAAWVVGNVWRATGREDDAYRLATDAADLLEPHLNDPDDSTRAMWGSVRLHAAITAAKMGREGDALRALDDGEAMAQRVSPGYTHPWTLFGPANAELTGVSVYVDLHKSAAALDRADAVNPDSVPSVDRRARLWLEMARSYHQRNDKLATLQVLKRATDISAEAMQCHPISRGLVGELVVSGGRLVESEARGLAGRLGMTV